MKPVDIEPPLVDAAQFNRAISAYPWFGKWVGARATAIGRDRARVKIDIRPELLREGDSVAGPVVMGLADLAMYALVMAVAPDGARAVTSDMTMHFLRRPKGKAMEAEARLIRRGRRSVVCAVDVFVDAEPESVCHIVGSYALPAGSGA